MPISVTFKRSSYCFPSSRDTFSFLTNKYEIPRSCIKIEITESIYAEEDSKIGDIAKELRDAGFSVYLDDFGSGYSSLNMLKEMPLDIIKMDLRFLEGDETKGHHILKALIEMAHTLELKVVVEGVELLSRVEFLRQFECSLQGYYFSKPIVVEEFEKMLE